jgi:predicted enzyme related to lactoylglutathione lyase|tara:strand:+ start:1416 stop:2003 length:588 start_codon:yes stop_codon:yes gene_type:complete
MYFAVNISKPPRVIVIGDLNVELQPRQAIDLEKMFDSHKLEHSQDLKHAQRIGVVQVKKDKGKKKPPEVIQQNQDLDQVRKAIKSEIQNQMSGVADAIKEGMNQEQILTVLQKLSSAIADGGMTKTVEHKIERIVESGGQIVEPKEDIDPAIAEVIHAKVVDKMVKESKSKVKYKEDKNEDKSMMDRVSELEGLL